jgi:two-component system NarL family sensor kinase
MGAGVTDESQDRHTLLDGERQVLEMIAAGAPLAAVLEALCRVIDIRTGLHSSIFLLDADGAHLRLMAGPNLPDMWRQAVRVIPSTATACGAAVTRREQVICPDMLSDPLYHDYREAAEAAGLRAVWSTPFLAKDRRALGTFAVYSTCAGAPTETNLRLVERATYLASIAVERHQTEEGLRDSERLLRVVLDALPVGVAVVDRRGDIILSNPASRRIWGRLLHSGEDRYRESQAWWYANGMRLAPEHWASMRAVSNGETSIGEEIEIEAFDGARKIIQNSAVPIRDGNGHITGAVVVNEDISANKTAERELTHSYSQMRALTGHLMRAQDDERRRIAQMLHETTAQNLAALKMLLARLKRVSGSFHEGDARALTDSIALAEQSMTEIRTLSYLLHPPFLDEAGLLSALRWYAGGFADRSGITVDLDLPESLARLPRDTETTLFRIVQESLTNIHRHAGSQTAGIRLHRDTNTLVLEIDDRGHGISKASLVQIKRGGAIAGVGIAGMIERMEQLGGTLDIVSGDHGTTVLACLRLVEDLN